MKSIVAISTPLGKGAISIIRISGADSLSLALNFFRSKDLTAKNIKPRYMYLGKFVTKNIEEKCLMVFFKAPNSYTGEDLVEFQIHGGEYLTKRIFEILVDAGARPAEGGELSKLAFLNGKISLDEAEGIIDVINADSESELRASFQLAGGELNKEITEIQNQVKEMLAKINVAMDYPEYDEQEALVIDVDNSLNVYKNKITYMIESYKNAKYINAGISIALIGDTNVGKSSLLNAILKENRAIVTDIAGTTRDTLTESIYHNGVKYNFIDTAGIRESTDTVEKLGIEKSKQAIKSADIVLFLLDATKKLDKTNNDLLESIKDKEHIVVVNKIDKERKLEKLENEIVVSALKNQGVEELLNKIYDKVIHEINYNGIIITNTRHVDILKEANNIIKDILSIDEKSLDILEFKLKKLWIALGKITGETENENIIDLIFSKFCLGK